MPHKSPDARNARDRARRAEKRAAALVALPAGDEPPEGAPGEPGANPPAVVAPLPLRNARDVLAALGEQLNLVRQDRHANTQGRARTVAYIAAVALKAVEISDLAERLEAVEAALKMRAALEEASGG